MRPGPYIRDNVAPLIEPSGEELGDQPDMFSDPETDEPVYNFVNPQLDS